MYFCGPQESAPGGQHGESPERDVYRAPGGTGVSQVRAGAWMTPIQLLRFFAKGMGEGKR